MRYRVFMRAIPPMEFECFRFEFDRNASGRKLNLFQADAKHAKDCIPIHLPVLPVVIRDEHNKIVWSEPTYVELNEPIGARIN